MDNIIVKIHMIDVVKSSLMLKRYVKRMVAKVVNLDHGVMMISEQVSDVL